MVMSKKNVHLDNDSNFEKDINESFLQMSVKEHSKILDEITITMTKIMNRLIILEKAVSDIIKSK